MKRLMMVLAPVLLVLVAATALPTTRAFAQDKDTTNIEEMIQNAKTPADYEAIADYYQKRGDEAQKQLEWHQSLYKTYEANPRQSQLRMHCHRLIRIYKDQAKEDKVMADQYRDMAKKAK
jgi:hypothetical protein